MYVKLYNKNIQFWHKNNTNISAIMVKLAEILDEGGKSFGWVSVKPSYFWIYPN